MATVLVVEDDKLSQRILSKMLAGGSHTALLAASIDEARQVLRQNVWVDLVILDNQLGQDWGWQFLEQLRADVLYQDLPVVVYTGHTERNSILRYVELGVKSMLVKPYKADIVFEEVAKAMKTDWPSKLLESPQNACERLQLKESDYYTLLSAGATSLEQTAGELRGLFSGRPNDRKIRENLQKLYSLSVSLGMPALRTVSEALARAIGARNSAAIQNCIENLDSLRILLRNRTLSYLGLEAFSASPRSGGSNPGLRVSPSLASPGGVGTLKDLFRRRTASTPIGKFHREFDRLTAERLFPGTSLNELIIGAIAHPLCAEMLNTVRFLNGAAQTASVDDLLAQIRKSKAIELLFAQVAARAAGQIDSGLDTSEVDFEQLINRLGIHKTVLLLAAHRLNQALQQSSLLDLSWLRKHTLISLLLGYEIARMLNSEDDLLVSSAAAVHQIGSWCFAIAEPGLYAVALAKAEDEITIEAAESSVFGQDHTDIAITLLTQAGFQPSFIQIAARAAQPDREAARDPLSLACAHLATVFAWAVIAQDDSHAQALRQRLLSPADPVWCLLQSSRTELPIDLPEFLDSLNAAARNCLLIVASLKAG